MLSHAPARTSTVDSGLHGRHRTVIADDNLRLATRTDRRIIPVLHYLTLSNRRHSLRHVQTPSPTCLRLERHPRSRGSGLMAGPEGRCVSPLWHEVAGDIEDGVSSLPERRGRIGDRESASATERHCDRVSPVVI